MAANPLLTPEDEEALRTLSHKMRKKSRRLNRLERFKAEESVLRPWEQVYAWWLAFAPVKTTVLDRRRKATELSHSEISDGHIRYLLGRKDFKALVAEFQKGGVEGALAKLKADMPFYVDAHRKGLEMAMAEQDYTAFPKFTLPALERVAPRHNDLAQTNIQVNVSYSQKQLALEDTPPLEVTVEPVPIAPPKL